MKFDATRIIQSELEPKERLLWSGQTGPRHKVPGPRYFYDSVQLSMGWIRHIMGILSN